MLDAATQGAWGELVERLRAFVARRAPASDVDDLVQEVLVRIHRRGGELRDDERFGPWVYRIARNAVVDHHRRRATRPVVGDAVDVAAPDGDDEEPMLLRCVAPFVARLPTPYREAVTLVDLQGMTQQEAADAVGLSLSGMKSRVQRGRRLLRAEFDACCAVALDARRRVIDAAPRSSCRCDDEGGGECAPRPGARINPDR